VLKKQVNEPKYEIRTERSKKYKNFIRLSWEYLPFALGANYYATIG
jgi:hypothetical protein